MTDLLGKSNKAAECGLICSAYVLINEGADSNRVGRYGFRCGVHYGRSHDHDGVYVDAYEHACEHDGAGACYIPSGHDRTGVYLHDYHGDGDGYDVHVGFDRDHGDAPVAHGGYDPAQMSIDVLESAPHLKPELEWKGQPCQPVMPL